MMFYSQRGGINLGVEAYFLKDNVMLYKAGSPEDFAGAVPLPDHAVGIVANAGDISLYVQEKFCRKPTEAEIMCSYLELGSALAKELRSQGIYSKEVLLTPSHPEFPLPEDLAGNFGKEKKAFKAVPLLWLWLVSSGQSQT